MTNTLEEVFNYLIKQNKFRGAKLSKILIEAIKIIEEEEQGEPEPKSGLFYLKGDERFFCLKQTDNWGE